MLDPRVYHTLTMLANGQVLAVGGEQHQRSEHRHDRRPADGDLGPDQRDVVRGGADRGRPQLPLHRRADARRTGAGRRRRSPDGLNDAGQDNAQIYSPSYLFNGPRPTITSAPSSATYGSTISVSTPDASSISAVNLVSLGTDTHQMDMNQHFVPLSFTASNGSINVTMPSSAAVAPPGHYMLFILNQSGHALGRQHRRPQPADDPVAPAAPDRRHRDGRQRHGTVSWTAPNDGNSPITSYTITPRRAQPR